MKTNRLYEICLELEAEGKEYEKWLADRAAQRKRFSEMYKRIQKKKEVDPQTPKL